MNLPPTASEDGVPFGAAYLGQAYCSEHGIMHWHGWARAVRFNTAAKAFAAVFAGGSLQAEVARLRADFSQDLVNVYRGLAELERRKADKRRKTEQKDGEP